MTAQVTTEDVAAWMLSELDRQSLLYQEIVVYDIAQRFGDQFTYVNRNGNLAITKNVLDAFRKLSGDDVVWVRRNRYWRRREPEDEPGRMQPY